MREVEKTKVQRMISIMAQHANQRNHIDRRRDIRTTGRHTGRHVSPLSSIVGIVDRKDTDGSTVHQMS